ncbi:MAG: site-specific DNA-methyltransferase [Ignavibacteriales bacterium]|nr:site-specific DNA-methyltransferase [Ignavibacteriales bacterium]
MAKKTKPTKKPTVKYPKLKDRATIPVAHVKHNDKRVNIPTEELRGFVAEDEITPKKVLYPRDPSLDPQLVWKGKDEQDSKPLEVPVVPIYIQEKIHPQAIIEDLRAQSQKDIPEDQIGLFGDFNGIKFEEMIDFYQHEQNWTNRAILGDSLLVMTSLAEKERLKGKVQSIYFDPPYGIKFGSNWQVSTRKNKLSDRAEDLTRQPEQVKAFRDTWQLGIHSYLAYLRDRFTVCRDLLTESGSLFIQIGEENVHLVRSVLDEVFGSENYCSQIAFRTATSQPTNLIACVYDYAIWYAKDKKQCKYRSLQRERDYFERIGTFGWLELRELEERSIRASEKRGESPIPEGAILFKDADITNVRKAEETQNTPSFRNGKYSLPGNLKYIDGIERLIASNRVIVVNERLCGKRYETDNRHVKFNSIWDDTMQGTFELTKDPKKYVVQTAPKVIQRCLLMTTDPGDLVLDPTCGSGTTAYVAEQWGRRWITIDTSRVALALARTRIMSAKYPYYLLGDSSEGKRKEMEIVGRVILSEAKNPDTEKKDSSVATLLQNDIKKGFVYKRVPHITLKSIANNEEIDTIHSKWQEKMEPIRTELNKALKQKWEEWEIPRELPANLVRTQHAVSLLEQRWNFRRARQKEIDESIAKRADTELLYDQPYEDNKRIRVAGPFTVESLSPHRVLSPADENLDGTVTKKEAKHQQDFTTMILDNLRKSGVQNTFKNERLKFDRLESFAGVWVHAKGEYTENGKSKRVAVSIGPEHGTVGPDMVKEAAKEAVEGAGNDLLIVCGFAFDPHVSEEAKRYGKLNVLTARMNPDLAMGDELLKKTGAGNLFMVFGEPDLDVKKQKDGKITVTIRGLDVYDPTTGEIRSSSTDDIACWFIDTNYNGESFFVRHAYFTGAEEPYDKLKRALRAEIDESVWSALYSTTSRPFDPPKTGKIAVKVINHYGDEVLRVYEVKK